ncbi:MAG: hypothetical protein Q8O57_01720, partial [Kiritimatiellota bacterium]|nr:hypothetical protein [Kiritimatiellota bacterium]
MPIISAIGRKHWKVRALFAGMYLFLVIGAASMVYPFMLMLAGSTKSAVDIKYFEAIPRFLHDDTWLYRKHIEGVFNESLIDQNVTYDRDDSAFERVDPPEGRKPGLLDEWRVFMSEAQLPGYAYQCGYLDAPVSRTIPGGLRTFKQDLMNRYGEDIAQVNRAMGTEFETWNVVRLNVQPLSRQNKPMATVFVKTLNDFKARMPVAWRYYASMDGYYKKMYLKPLYGLKIEEYNRAHGTHYGSYNDIRLVRRWAENGAVREREDWAQFVRLTLAPQWIRVDGAALAEYHEYLQAKHDTIATLNKCYATSYRDFQEVPLIGDPPLVGMALSDWEAFIVGWKDPDTKRLYQAPVETLRIFSVEW